KAQIAFRYFSESLCLATKYDNTNDLKDIFRCNGKDTVLSTLNPPIPEVQAAQNNFIRAAIESGTVQRFIASEWDIY
ncbi:MAG: hypothetical protein LQ345_002515, partial [Seirophora villosa]